MQTADNYHMGAVGPSVPDSRDTDFPLSAVPSQGVPRQHYVLSRVPANQGKQGSCVAHALTHAAETELLVRQGIHTDLSRAFLYQEARAMRGWRDKDTGCFVREAVQVLAEQGTCSENVMPYVSGDYRTRPSKKAYAEGQRNRAAEFHLVPSADLAVGALAADHAVVVAFTVYSNFSEARTTGKWPTPSGPVLGGHSVALMGYDLDGQRLLACNWWQDRGPWGMPHPLAGTDERFAEHRTGYWWIPFAAYESRDFWDCFSVHHFALEV